MLATSTANAALTPAQHAWTLLVFAFLTGVLLLCGRRRDRPTRYVLAAVSFGAWLFSGVFYLLPDHLELNKSLPIQACDLLVLFAGVTLVLPSRLMRSVMYFGGFGMTLQAFATPTSDIGGPSNIKFWIFWLLHGAIVATAVYVVAIDRFRPQLRDLVSATLFWLVYALAMVGLNYGAYAAGWNDGQGWYYGYLGPTLPEIVSQTILGRLGDWPLRPIVMMLMMAGVFVLLYLPWLAVKPRGESSLDQDELAS